MIAASGLGFRKDPKGTIPPSGTGKWPHAPEPFATPLPWILQVVTRSVHGTLLLANSGGSARMQKRLGLG